MAILLITVQFLLSLRENILIYVWIVNCLLFHMSIMLKRLGKLCGIISKLRHYVLRRQLIQYYEININPIFHYGNLVYGCISDSSLSKIYLQKNLKFIYFRKRVDHSEDIFISNKILTVYELHIYELLKFVLRSVNQLHSETFLNDLFVFEKPKITRSDAF